MSKHTPGPWEVSSDCRELWPADGEKAFVEFCRLSSWYSDDELAANARLIAAAPDLLKACVEACLFAEEAQHHALCSGVKNDAERIYGVLRQAIAKTREGEQDE